MTNVIIYHLLVLAGADPHEGVVVRPPHRLPEVRRAEVDVVLAHRIECPGDAQLSHDPAVVGDDHQLAVDLSEIGGVGGERLEDRRAGLVVAVDLAAVQRSLDAGGAAQPLPRPRVGLRAEKGRAPCRE